MSESPQEGPQLPAVPCAYSRSTFFYILTQHMILTFQTSMQTWCKLEERCCTDRDAFLTVIKSPVQSQILAGGSDAGRFVVFLLHHSERFNSSVRKNLCQSRQGQERMKGYLKTENPFSTEQVQV